MRTKDIGGVGEKHQFNAEGGVGIQKDFRIYPI